MSEPGIVPAVAGKLAEAAGKPVGDLLVRLLGPTADVYGGYLAYKATKQVEQWKATAALADQMIVASGRPTTDIQDDVLLAIIEGISVRDDKDLQRAWASLLANAATHATGVRVAYATILMDLEPQDAVLLNELYEATLSSRKEPGHLERNISVGENLQLIMVNTQEFCIQRSNPPHDMECFGVLQKHNLIDASREISFGQAYRMTALGMGFTKACRPPKPNTD